jgi:RHS repeat-associated protein
MTNIAYSDGTPSVSFTYDRLGRQVAITDATGSRTFTYNAALQLAAETNAFGVLVRSYDALGRPAGFVLGSDYSVGYGFDEVGRFSSVTSFVAFVPFVVNYSYLTGTDLLSGWSSPTGHAVTRAFEPHRDLLTAVSNRYNGATVSAFDYLNDALARRTQRLDTGRAGPPDPPVTNRFAYNPRSELTSAAMGTNQYGYAYDPIGNRMSATNNAETLTYLSNALNQYTNITDGVTLTPTYDLDGNLTNYNGWTFAWSGENRLILASNTAHRVEYAYDYQGRMSQKVVDGQTNSLIWDGFNIIQVLTHTQTHTLTNAFIWGLDLSQSLQGAGGVGGLLAEVQDGAPHYAAFDANGNVTEYVSTNGTIVAHYEYSPFGEIVVQSGNLADSFTHRFSTKPWCAVTGTSEYELRMYSPELGRWISRDPIEEYGGWHLSAAMGNNMVCFWDLLGLANITADNGVPKNCTIVVIYDHGASRKKPKIIDDISPNSPMGEAAQKFTDEGYGGIGLIGCWSAQTIIQVDKLRKQQEQERTAKRAKRKVNIIPVPWINTLPGAEMSLVWRKLQPGLCQGEQINNIAGPGERPYLSGMNDMNSMDDFYYPPKRWSDINSGIDAGVKAKAKCLFNDGCRKVRVVYTDADGDVLVDADGAPLRDEIILPQ